MAFSSFLLSLKWSVFLLMHAVVEEGKRLEAGNSQGWKVGGINTFPLVTRKNVGFLIFCLSSFCICCMHELLDRSVVEVSGCGAKGEEFNSPQLPPWNGLGSIIHRVPSGSAVLWWWRCILSSPKYTTCFSHPGCMNINEWKCLNLEIELKHYIQRMSPCARQGTSMEVKRHTWDISAQKETGRQMDSSRIFYWSALSMRYCVLIHSCLF